MPRAADHLPVVESDRDIDDWGRSARLSAILDRRLWSPAYHRWFRVELEQPAQIPAFGGALLVVNGGAGSPVAALVAKAIRQRHRRRRDARPCVSPALLAQPGLSVLLRRAGAVAAQTDDLIRLLGDEQQLVVLATRTDRLDDDGATAGLARHPAIEAAVRSGVPVVPIAALGAGDGARVLARVPLPGGARLPIPLGLPAVGPVEPSGYFPTPIVLRALAPLLPDSTLTGSPQDGSAPPADADGSVRDAAVRQEAERLALSVARRLRHEHADMRRGQRRGAR